MGKGFTDRESEGTFWDNGNILYLDFDGCYAIICIYETTWDWHLKWADFIKIAISVLRLFNLSGSRRVITRATAHGYISCVTNTAPWMWNVHLRTPVIPAIHLLVIVSPPLFYPNKGRDNPVYELVIHLPSKVLVRKSYPQKCKNPQLSTSLCHI